MIGPEVVLAAFDGFELPMLTQEWVSPVWQERFSTCPEDLPDDYSERFPLLNHTDTLDIIKECQKVINKWLLQDAEASWTNLQELDYKSLTALLYYYAKKAASNYNSLPSVELGIKAADLYFSLLLIPGSNIYHIFQVALFEACLEVFTLQRYLQESPAVQRKNKNNRSMDNCEFIDNETMSLQQKRFVVKHLNTLLNSLRVLVGKFSFESQMEALRMSMSMLAELTRLERAATVDIFLRCEDTASLTLLAKNAYLTIKDLCIELHGRIGEIVRLALFRIMPNLTLLGGSNIPEMDKWTGKEQTVVRNLALWFVRSHIVPLGEPAHTHLKVLVENMCRIMPERADYRAKATDTVVAIIAEFPEGIYYKMLKWMFYEAMAPAAASYRIVAIEIISKLIYMKQGASERSNMADGTCTMSGSSTSMSHVEISTHLGDPSHMEHAGEITSVGSTSSSTSDRLVSFCKPIDYLPLEFRRVMLAIVIDRMRDEAVTVRAKAMNVLAEIVSNRSSPTVQKLVAEVLVAPYRSMDAIDMGGSENGFVKWDTFVHSIDQMREPETSKAMVPGGRHVIRQVLNQCGEDRVTVRRAALLLLVQIFKLNAKWMTKQNVETFGRHCREKSMSIRKEMVGWVTDLMLFYPSHHELTQLWVVEVIPQVKDREIRVQENVMQVLSKIVLCNIKPLDKTRSSMDELPWRLLMHIAKLNMKSFLVEACLQWRNKSTPELGPAKISAIMSHIGSDRNTAAWVLLSSISEYYDTENPQPIMDYYIETVAMGLGDHGNANLVLTTLWNWWQKLAKDSQLSLMRRLAGDLANLRVPPYIVSQVVTILTEQMVMLGLDEEQGRKDVAMWAVEQTQTCERHLEVCLTDVNVNPGKCDKCLFYVTLLGCLADIHPDQICQQTFDLLFKFVMTRHAGIDRPLSDLKAAGVISLGKMALRDNFIASKLVSGLSVLMNRSTDLILLNNVVVAVAEIGERYANLIEPLVSPLCLCLKSRHLSLQETTLKILIELLQEDYLKPRGALLYQLMSLTVSPNAHTVCIVKVYFTNCLFAKGTVSLDNMLLTSIFHFNKNYDHPHYPRMDMSEAEEAAFDFSGAEKTKQRLEMYRFLLRDASNLHRIRCAQFLCNVILNAYADDILSLDHVPGVRVLSDTLQLLTCKEIMVDCGKKKGEDGEEEDEEGGEAGGGVRAAAKAGHMKELLREVEKRTIAEYMVPICCKLRKKLGKHQRLRRLLYRYVREVVRDYKNEIMDMFRDDRQFGHEILHEVNHTTRGQPDEDDEEEEEISNKKETPRVQTGGEPIVGKGDAIESLPNGDANRIAVALQNNLRSSIENSVSNGANRALRSHSSSPVISVGNSGQNQMTVGVEVHRNRDRSKENGANCRPNRELRNRGSSAESSGANSGPNEIIVGVDVHHNRGSSIESGTNNGPNRALRDRSSSAESGEKGGPNQIMADVDVHHNRAIDNIINDPNCIQIRAEAHDNMNKTSKRKSDELAAPEMEVTKKTKPCAVVDYDAIEEMNTSGPVSDTLEEILDDLRIVQELTPPKVPAGEQEILMKELQIVLTDIHAMNSKRAGRSRTASAENSKDSTSTSSKSNKTSKDDSEKSAASTRSGTVQKAAEEPAVKPTPRTTKSAGKSLMAPPSAPPSRRQSGRKAQPSTPNVALRNKLKSSTPMQRTPSADSFESDISPVVQATTPLNRCDGTS